MCKTRGMNFSVKLIYRKARYAATTQLFRNALDIELIRSLKLSLIISDATLPTTLRQLFSPHPLIPDIPEHAIVAGN